MAEKRIINVTIAVVVDDNGQDLSVEQISDSLDIQINGENNVTVKEYDTVEAFEIF